MPQDQHQRARECYDDVKEAWRKNHERMREDLRFSNPVDPQQWDAEARRLRKDRVCLTLDRTNQYIVQVVNNARMNKPAITTMPADSKADVEVATALDGIMRHIEYRSRAQIAYDWAMEGAARCGIGWMRVNPRIVDPETNTQEICIDRVVDHLSVIIDGDQPDGSDARHGFAETLVPIKQFKKQFPKASTANWESDTTGWFCDEMVRVCEYQYIEEDKRKMLVVADPMGNEIKLSEDDYRELVAKIGSKPKILKEFQAIKRTVKWLKLNGKEVLEDQNEPGTYETTLPGSYIGMVPVVGFELFLDGERYICGVTRRLMDGQRAYNYERSALVEAVALQPKAPIMVPIESTEGHEEHWQNLNTGQPAYLPYNALDGEGRQLPVPQRMAPPSFPAAFAQSGQIAVGDMEAAVGMYQANLGQPNNANSGKQERERKNQGAVATFHYADNQARSIEHLGRIVVGMVPTIYDKKRQAKILGIDGQQSSVEIDPSQPKPAMKRGNKVVSINLSVGIYDVRVKTGPSFTTQREEAAEGMREALQAAPNASAVLLPALMKMQDWPDAERYSRALLALAPPAVQQILGEDEGEEAQIPPQVQAQLQQLQQQGEHMTQMLDAGEAEVKRLTEENEKLKALAQIKTAELAARVESDEEDEKINRYKSQTERMKVVGELMAKGLLGGVPAASADAESGETDADPEPAADTAAEAQMQLLQAMTAQGQAIGDVLAQTMAAMRSPQEQKVATLQVQRDANGMLTGVVPVYQGSNDG